MKCVIFENLSTSTKIKFLPNLDLDKPRTKSIEIFLHGSLGISNGVHNPCGCSLDFAWLQVISYKFSQNLYSYVASKIDLVKLPKS